MDLNRIDLNLLVAFDALMAERSVTRAAERLSVGQSAMSSTLGRLRKVLGDPLLVREGRVLVPTPRAEALEQPIRDILTSLEGLLTGGQPFDPARDERTFTVMGTDYLAMTFLHPLMVRLGQVAPGVRLHVRRPGEDVEEDLRRRRVDLAILPREALPRSREYRREVLSSDRYVCVVAADNPDVGDTLTLEQFSALPYLASNVGSRRTLIEDQLDRLGVERRTEFTAGIGLTPLLLQGTRLVTLIPEQMALRFAPMADLRLVAPPMELEPITAVMVWSARHDDDAGHAFLREQISELAAAPGAGREPA